MIVLIFITFLFAIIVNWLIERKESKIKSDEDLLWRFMVYEHRRSRKEKKLPYLY